MKYGLSAKRQPSKYNFHSSQKATHCGPPFFISGEAKAMASFNKFSSFVEAVTEKKHDLGADVLKVMLTNVAPVAANTVKADLTDIGAGNGYTAGGTAATISSSAQTAGVYKLVLADVVFTATGAIGPFRYATLYNDTATNDELIAWWDYGSSISLANGETFTVDFDATTGVLQLT